MNYSVIQTVLNERYESVYRIQLGASDKTVPRIAHQILATSGHKTMKGNQMVRSIDGAMGYRCQLVQHRKHVDDRCAMVSLMASKYVRLVSLS
ncbi:hypothetical protein PoB_005151300 [Plakobranchus ocellatus]|uniref:Uncharacterized protein n=1 Tax=Plakobranchus ocellatus TaxID=259542 RepID=A0AAV4C0R8_9GAST|nr:hypothetical protein PoB_005151300 [Plakobranchus ocellatus]